MFYCARKLGTTPSAKSVSVRDTFPADRSGQTANPHQSWRAHRVVEKSWIPAFAAMTEWVWNDGSGWPGATFLPRHFLKLLRGDLKRLGEVFVLRLDLRLGLIAADAKPVHLVRQVFDLAGGL